MPIERLLSACLQSQTLPCTTSPSPTPPHSCTHRVVQKFTVCERKERGGSGTYGRTKTLKNQLVLHALCLALVLEGCRLEFDVLAADLKMSPQETRQMMRELVSSTSCCAALEYHLLGLVRPSTGVRRTLPCHMQLFVVLPIE